LLHANLHEVFLERDPDARRAAIERTYAEDVRFIDAEAEVVGRDAVSERVHQLVDGHPAEFVLEEDGAPYVGGDVGALAWRLGPPGSPVARGIDILTVRDDRVILHRTLLAIEAAP
jgi:hypothetical protein